MKGIAVAILSIFSVVIPIQSHELTYTYNYNSFGEIFPQDDSVVDRFHLDKYEDIHKIFDTEYTGKNNGGAFLVQGNNKTYTSVYEGELVDITATFYCGGTYAEEGANSLEIFVNDLDGNHDYHYPCQERGWRYNYKWIPSTSAKYQDFYVRFMAYDATIDKPYGFDELRITTRVEPPQLLQHDNNTSSIDP